MILSRVPQDGGCVILFAIRLVSAGIRVNTLRGFLSNIMVLEHPPRDTSPFQRPGDCADNFMPPESTCVSRTLSRNSSKITEPCGRTEPFGRTEPTNALRISQLSMLFSSKVARSTLVSRYQRMNATKEFTTVVLASEPSTSTVISSSGSANTSTPRPSRMGESRHTTIASICSKTVARLVDGLTCHPRLFVNPLTTSCANGAKTNSHALDGRDGNENALR